MAWKSGEEQRIREESVSQRQRQLEESKKIRFEAVQQRQKQLEQQRQSQLQEKTLKLLEKQVSEEEHPYRTAFKKETGSIARRTPKFLGSVAKGMISLGKLGYQEWKKGSERYREPSVSRYRQPLFPSKPPSRKFQPSRISQRGKFKRTYPPYRPIPKPRGKVLKVWRKKGGMTIIKRAGELPEIRW